MTIPKINTTKIRWEMIYLSKLILYSYIIRLKQYFFTLLGKTPKIHIIGDSHVFSLVQKNACIHYIGAATAHNLIKKDSLNKSNEKIHKLLGKIKTSNQKLLILVFGEIDCRLHIYYQYKKQASKTTIEKLISQTIQNYGEFILELKQDNFNLAVFNAVPQGEQPNLYKFPNYASRKIRCLITVEFNRQLKKWCKQHKIYFIDVFNELSDNDGHRKKIYKLDRVHFNTKLSTVLFKYLERDASLSQFLN